MPKQESFSICKVLGQDEDGYIVLEKPSARTKTMEEASAILLEFDENETWMVICRWVDRPTQKMWGGEFINMVAIGNGESFSS